MEEITNKPQVTSIVYQTAAYGGGNDDVSNSEVFTHASTESIDLSTDFSSIVSGLTALLVLKIAEATGASASDSFKFHLYRRHDNLWSGNEVAVEADIYNAVPGNGVTIEYSYQIGLDVTKGGPGHYRIGMESTGATDDFDVQATVVVSRLVAQGA